jgi:hypothetical protein
MIFRCCLKIPTALGHEKTEISGWSRRGVLSSHICHLRFLINALWDGFSETERKKIQKRIAANRKKLAKWAKFAPENNQHKLALVEAELARVNGDHGRTRELYDEAARGAHEHQFMQDEALAYELAGRYYLERGMYELAQYYLHSAYRAYQRWGERRWNTWKRNIQVYHRADMMLFKSSQPHQNDVIPRHA